MAPVASPERVIEAQFVPTLTQGRVWDVVGEAPAGSLSLIGYGGALGGGKSRTICELGIDLSLEFPGNRILIGRKDFADLRTTTMEEFYRVCPRELIVKRNDSEHWCWLRLSDWPEGQVSAVHFRELKDYQGLGSEPFGAVLVDEAGEVPENSAKMLIGRLRSWVGSPPNVKYVFLAGSNPYPGWFEDWFVSRELPEQVLAAAGGKVTFIPSRIADNPFLPPNYEALLRGIYTDDDWLSRMVEGRFDSFTGQVYRELSTRQEWSGELPRFSRLVGGLDFGGAKAEAHKTAGVVAGLTTRDNPGMGENNLVRFGHFEHSGADVHESLMTWMRQIEAVAGRRVNWRADKTQMWGISLASGSGFIIEPSHGGADSVDAGVGLVRRRMKDATSWFMPDLRQVPRLDGRKLNGRSWYDAMRRYREEDGKYVKLDDDTADADRYMHEEADGFPVMPYKMPKTNTAGKPLARYAV